MHYRHSILTLIITLALASFVQASFAEPYVSVTGYQITPPTGWKQTEQISSGKVIFTGPVHHKPAPTIQVATIRLLSPVSSEFLSAAGDNVIKGIKTFPSFHLINKEETTIAGEPSESILATFRSTPKGPLLRSWQLFVTHDTNAFLITSVCVASEADEWRTAFRSTIQSFDFAMGNGHRFVSKYGYSFLPISNWTVKPNTEGADVFVVEQNAIGFAANLGVRVKELKDPNTTAESLFEKRDEMNAELRASAPGYQPISQKISTAVNVPAVDTIFLMTITTLDGSSIPVRVHQIKLPHGHLLYMFTFIGLASRASEQEVLFQRMLNSIQWPKE